MKIILLTDYYDQYLVAFAMRHAPALSGLNYQQHLEYLLADNFGSFVSYRNHLRKIGCECELIVANDYPLQQKWLAENGLTLSAGPATKQRVVLQQLQAWKPDAFFMSSMFDFYGSFLHEVADNVTRNIFTWIACPYPHGLDFSPVRCLLSSTLTFVDEFRRAGVKSERLRAAFDDDILPKLGELKRDLELSFVGNLSLRSHADRVKLLSSLYSAGLPIEIWGCRSPSRTWRQRIRNWVFRDGLDGMVRGEAWGIDMYRVLMRSRITFNVHIDIARERNVAANMRLYEATGCGALLVTDRAPDLGEVFDPEKELVAFDGLDDLIERLKYYIEHPQESASIAAAGQKACLGRHTYRYRILEFCEILQRYMS